MAPEEKNRNRYRRGRGSGRGAPQGDDVAIGDGLGPKQITLLKRNDVGNHSANQKDQQPPLLPQSTDNVAVSPDKHNRNSSSKVAKSKKRPPKKKQDNVTLLKKAPTTQRTSKSDETIGKSKDALCSTKELVDVKAELENESKYRAVYQQMLSKLKEELEFEHKQRIALQDDLSKADDLICIERSRAEELKKEMEERDAANKSIQNEVLVLNNRLEEEQKMKDSIQSNLNAATEMLRLERGKTGQLEKKYKMEAAANLAAATVAVKLEVNSLRMELQTAKSKLSQVNDLEEMLRLEQLKSEQWKHEATAVTAVRIEAKSLRAKLQSMLAEIQGLEHQLKMEKIKSEQLKKDATVAMATRMEVDPMRIKFKPEGATLSHTDNLEEELRLERLKSEQSAIELRTAKEKIYLMDLNSKTEEDKISKLNKSLAQAKVANLRQKFVEKNIKKELEVLRSKLKDQRRKYQALYASQRAKEVRSGKLSLSDWMEKPPDDDISVDRGASEDLCMYQSPTAIPDMPPAVETSLPTTSLTTTSSDSLPDQEIDARLYFDGVVDEGSNGMDSSPLEDELAFIKCAYAADEITIEENRVTYFIQLPLDGDANEGQIQVDLTLCIPNGYPSGVLGVEAAINEDTNCSPDVRRCAIDALPKLKEICTWEANGNQGNEAMLSVFNVAESWAKNDWHGIVSKHCTSLREKNQAQKCESSDSKEICCLLIHAHHINDADKIQMVKKASSKLSLGGFIKTGKPGLILVEGAEANCEAILEALNPSRKQKEFLRGGHVLMKIDSDIDSCRHFSRKMVQLENKSGMDELKDACKEVGLDSSLNDICSP
jgi:hypothetical protein